MYESVTKIVLANVRKVKSDARSITIHGGLPIMNCHIAFVMFHSAYNYVRESSFAVD